ncbi:hypothetical protein U8Q02_28065 (plasmid) [Rhizobium leguminosarum]|nr:hypothetical protein [Rhizobium leguminosarum]WSH75174.1 hypothetical protein U8Q02_28065 [Rhizobium leguminosarum]
MKPFVQQGWFRTAFVIAGLAISTASEAANTPCSGSKGGINRCQGETFICRDGSVSASKKSCTAAMGTAALLGAAPENMTPTPSGDCSCRSGKFCIGSRGGHYCLSDSGKKSYLKKRILT